MAEIFSKNKHLLLDLAKAGKALHSATTKHEKDSLEDILVYLALTLERHARCTHYFEKEKHTYWWERAAAKFRIGEKVGAQMRAGKKDPKWIKERVEFWVDYALDYHPKDAYAAMA